MMQSDFAVLIAIVVQLLEMFPPGMQAKGDQIRADIAILQAKYEAGTAAWDQQWFPDPGPPPIAAPPPGP